MSNVKGLRLLAGLKQRRLLQLDEAVKAARQVLRERTEALQAALGEEQACQADEARRRDALLQTSSNASGFRPCDVVTLQDLLADAQQRSVAAVQRTRQAQQQAAAAEEGVQASQRAFRRGEQQLDQCRDRLAKALQAIEREQEEQQDEESEEAAVARMLAHARQEATAA